MHHYPFHPGDYMLDTAHLSLEEDATYRRALDLYYVSEGPLPADKRTLSKRLRVDEQTLENILREFFELMEDGWHHSRCDDEIAHYKAKSEKAKKAGSLGGKAKSSGRKANAKRTLSERQADAKLTKNQNQEPVHKGDEPIFPEGLPSDYQDILKLWWRYKKERKESYKPIGWNTLIEQQRVKPIAILIRDVKFSMGQNWAGIYPPKETQPATAQRPTSHIRSCL